MSPPPVCYLTKKSQRRKEEWMDQEDERQVWMWFLPSREEAGPAGIFPVRGDLQYSIRPRHQPCEALVPGSGVEPSSARLCCRYCARLGQSWAARPLLRWFSAFTRFPWQECHLQLPSPVTSPKESSPLLRPCQLSQGRSPKPSPPGGGGAWLLSSVPGGPSSF